MGAYPKGTKVVVSRDLYKDPSDIFTADNWNTAKYLLSGVGAFGIYPIKMLDEYNYMNDYLKNRGLSWSDIKYPGIAPKSGSGVRLSMSKMVKHLYD